MSQALEIFERVRQGNGIGFSHKATGEVAAAGRYDEATAAFEAAIGQFERIHDPVLAARSRFRRASALAAAGRIAEARAELMVAERLLGGRPLPEVPPLRERLHIREGPGRDQGGIGEGPGRDQGRTREGSGTDQGRSPMPGRTLRSMLWLSGS